LTLQGLEPDGRHGEDIHRDQVVDVVRQERAPRLRGGIRRRTIYLLTLVSPMSMPSVSSSPWLRGAPQSGFSRLMRRIRSRMSRERVGLSCLAAAPFPRPRQSKAFLVPRDDRLPLDDHESMAPVEPKP
jgi:hypothetical protein